MVLAKSRNFLEAFGLFLMEGGTMNSLNPLKSTYRWLCWEYEARRWRTNWCVMALETPSMPKVKLACSSTERCPILRILARNFSVDEPRTFFFSSPIAEGE